MKSFKVDIFIFLGLLVLTAIILLSMPGQNSIDLQFHDTYFVLDKISMTTLIVAPLTFLIFLTRGLTKKFRTPVTNIGLIVGLILVALITYQIIRIQQSYLIEMMKLDDEGLPDKGQLLLDIETKRNWTWGLFALWTVGLFLLTVRTIKVWKDSMPYI